jgi:hypothetical protein
MLKKRGRPRKYPEFEIVNCCKLVHNELKRNGSKDSRVYFGYSPIDGALCIAIKKNGEDVEIKHSSHWILEDGIKTVFNCIKSWGYPYDARMEIFIQKGILQ